jgi:hypothetical protein
MAKKVKRRAAARRQQPQLHTVTVCFSADRPGREYNYLHDRDTTDTHAVVMTGTGLCIVRIVRTAPNAHPLATNWLITTFNLDAHEKREERTHRVRELRERLAHETRAVTCQITKEQVLKRSSTARALVKELRALGEVV